MVNIPKKSPYVIIGAGIHGLSTAYHLALEFKKHSSPHSGRDIIIIDKSHRCAGATGIACGVIRNNYFQPAMRELMAHSVRQWESDAVGYSYHPVGYMQISCELMHEDVASIYAQQQAIDYESTFVEGSKDCDTYMKALFHDWQAQGITSVLHEKKGGYANNTKAMDGLAAKALAEGVSIYEGVTVIDLKRDNQGAICEVVTDRGAIECDYVVVAVGPWARQFWQMLEQPEHITVHTDKGDITTPMWTYWSLQEGTLGIDPKLQVTNDGNMPPVIHVDTDAPLFSVEDGALITDKLWGIYYKPDFHFGGVQGGAAPFIIDKPAEEVAVDPYGVASKDFIVGERFAVMWVSALAHCQRRFQDCMPLYKKEPSGGIGAFTPDSFPVFDVFCENCYFIADSNHGYKMLGVGQLVAQDILSQGNDRMLLKPFRFSRYATGELHPVSNSPYPWS